MADSEVQQAEADTEGGAGQGAPQGVRQDEAARYAHELVREMVSYISDRDMVRHGLDAKLNQLMWAMRWEGDPHEVFVFPRPKMDTPVGLFGAGCTCGWVSKGLETRRGALTSGRQHLQAKHATTE